MFFLRFTRFDPSPVNHLGKVINCTNHSKGKHDDQKCHNVLIQVTPENRCNQYSQKKHSSAHDRRRSSVGFDSVRCSIEIGGDACSTKMFYDKRHQNDDDQVNGQEGHATSEDDRFEDLIRPDRMKQDGEH